MGGFKGDKIMGTVMFVTGVLGSAGCVLLLIILPGIFEKQRKKLLKNSKI